MIDTTYSNVLANNVGVLGVFSDWPATTTFFANCMGLSLRSSEPEHVSAEGEKTSSSLVSVIGSVSVFTSLLLVGMLV